MESLTGVFVGFKKFNGKNVDKEYHVISLLFIDLDEMNDKATYFVKDIFINEKDYNKFVNEHQLLSYVDVKRGIVGDSVRYYI